MPERLSFQELSVHPVSAQQRANLAAAAEPLRDILGARRAVLTLSSDSVRFENMVGSALLPNGDIVEVSPKVGGDEEWTDAVVQLLDPSTRIAVTGSRRSQPSAIRNDLSAALAVEYARRLDNALRLDGPLQVYERQHRVSSRLHGHLDVTRYMRTSVLNPTRFPQGRDELTVANDFTRGLSMVAGWLARATANGVVASHLRRLQSAVLPGHPIPTHVDPAVSRRPIPSQWAKYKPAWDIASPLLRHLSVIGDPGRATGLEVAVESWPLLETALTRALRTLERRSMYNVEPKGEHALLQDDGVDVVTVIPDGLLSRCHRPLASFECKYTVPNEDPSSAHAQQALATAVAVGASVSVLVYPGNQEPKYYTPVGFREKPMKLVTIGLSLFSYHRNTSDTKNADLIERTLNTAMTTGDEAEK